MGKTCSNLFTFPKAEGCKKLQPYNKYKTYLLEASKPLEGAGVEEAGSVPGAEAGAPGTTAETGGVVDDSGPKTSKPVSRRLFCAGAKAGASVGAAGARVGEIKPEGHHTQKHTQR